METPHVDRPLSVERLTPADLTAAGQAVAAILATACGVTSAPGKPPFSLVVHWEEAPGGERWVVSLAGPAGVDGYAKAIAVADYLLQPILRLLRPRALRHFYRSRMDEASAEELGQLIDAMAQAMTMPSADYTEPRWVEDRCIVEVSAPAELGPATFGEALARLADIAARAANE